ncbi:MAG: hypothetical protein AABY10_04615 [Nanoarchaeota archaeon]
MEFKVLIATEHKPLRLEEFVSEGLTRTNVSPTYKRVYSAAIVRKEIEKEDYDLVILGRDYLQNESDLKALMRLGKDKDTQIIGFTSDIPTAEQARKTGMPVFINRLKGKRNSLSDYIRGKALKRASTYKSDREEVAA